MENVACNFSLKGRSLVAIEILCQRDFPWFSCFSRNEHLIVMGIKCDLQSNNNNNNNPHSHDNCKKKNSRKFKKHSPTIFTSKLRKNWFSLNCLLSPFCVCFSCFSLHLSFYRRFPLMIFRLKSVFAFHFLREHLIWAFSGNWLNLTILFIRKIA